MAPSHRWRSTPAASPLITDPDQARASPELAVLSAVAHPVEADDEQVLEAMLAGLATLDEDRARVYLNYVISSLQDVTVKRLEEMVTTIQDFDYLGDKYFSHWKDQGRAEALLIMLDARGLEISDDVRERIQRCEDTNQLEAWVRRAAVITTVDELFD
ncbi:hypothetical protein AAH991_12545 [Microbispora sp. ZYX-F-249]|uniref:Uncharacterized protein n=1 Tax=Microbispora maris TaxID=3144104 RepID=A0ABV0AMY9_9ACTN